jgi:hypothetical protein
MGYEQRSLIKNMSTEPEPKSSQTEIDFGDTHIPSAIGEAEKLRQEILAMSDEEKRIFYKMVQQKCLDFAAGKIPEPATNAELRKAIAITSLSFSPIVPEKEPKEPKEPKTSKKSSTEKKLSSKDLVADLFAQIPPSSK